MRPTDTRDARAQVAQRAVAVRARPRATPGAGTVVGAPAPRRSRGARPGQLQRPLRRLAVRDHVGDAWYQTDVRVPARWAGERIVLRFDSATHRAVVWVNGTQVAEHEGGYTPFEADVTDVVALGAENRDHRRSSTTS